MVTLGGCDAFVRKFTRKPKKEEKKEEEMVLVPQEYQPEGQFNQDLYRNYYIVWRSWHSELIDSLVVDGNHKKQIECIRYLIQNLENMRQLLKEQKQQILDNYLKELNKIQDKINQPNLNISDFSLLKDKLTIIQRDIQREFSYTKVKPWLK
jgi:Arc/MetJ-type ribon-helix-helix transcriptional regulator